MLETVIGLIPTLGFPAVCLIACGYFIYKIWNNQVAQQHEREETLLHQMAKFSDTLEDFNETLTRIDMRLEVLEKKN